MTNCQEVKCISGFWAISELGLVEVHDDDVFSIPYVWFSDNPS